MAEGSWQRVLLWHQPVGLVAIGIPVKMQLLSDVYISVCDIFILAFKGGSGARSSSGWRSICLQRCQDVATALQQCSASAGQHYWAMTCDLRISEISEWNGRATMKGTSKLIGRDTDQSDDRHRDDPMTFRQKSICTSAGSILGFLAESHIWGLAHYLFYYIIYCQWSYQC